MSVWVGRSRVTLIVAILTLAQLKVTVADGKIDEPVLDNDVLPPREYDVATHPHSSQTKPTKLDLDMTRMTMTDNKILHQREAEKLNATETRCARSFSTKCIRRKLENIMDVVSKSDLDAYNVTDSIQIVRNPSRRKSVALSRIDPEKLTLFERVKRFANNYALKIKLPTDLLTSRKARTFFGGVFQEKSTFLTGFGLGFLAFGLKKLLLPLILGVQIIKSILIALFLPSIIGSIGKIVGKGVSTFAQSSQSATALPEENFEFKDNEYFNEDYMTNQPPGTLPASAMYDETMLQKSPEIANRFGYADRYPHMNSYSDRYYTKYMTGNRKKQDFKNFHEIPSSSLLLTNYDPFYSPLLSRLDAVFSRLGHTTEGCREFAVCAMYRTPARYAPYSNLVSAQLSRELNELRKPSSDNPDVMRFFRYMKAAKDGQDGVNCEDVYRDCAMAREDQSLSQNQAMLATYQDIDKLVRARKL